MKTKHWLLVGAAVCASAGSAVAVPKGGALFIKARNTKIYKSPSATSEAVTTMQPGQEVKWQAADKTKPWHKVEVNGQEGFTLQSNLSPTKPTNEVTSGGGSVDAQAFASSGAATKALGDGAVAYGKKQGKEESVKQLLALEALAKQVKMSEVAAHAKAAGIFQVVGDDGAQTAEVTK